MPVEVCLGSTLRVTSLNVGELKVWAGSHCIPALNQTHVNSGRGGGVRVTHIKKKQFLGLLKLVCFSYLSIWIESDSKSIYCMGLFL